MHTTTEPKRETLNIRIKADVRDLIDRAAKSRGKKRTDFILESARAAAEDALLDQVILAVSPQAYAGGHSRALGGWLPAGWQGRRARAHSRCRPAGSAGG